MTKKIIAWGLLVVLVLGSIFAFTAPADATTNPEQTLECEVIGVDYMRPLVNGDHINMEIQRPDGSKYQVNAYVDRNVAGGYNTLGLRINGFDPIPLTKEVIESGYLVWRYGDYINDDIYRVTFVQTNSTDTWPDKDCPEVPPTTEPTPTAPTATVTVPGETVTLPGETITVPGDTVTIPGDTVTAPGETVTQPGQTVTQPGTVVTVPGQTETVYTTVPGGKPNVPGYVNSGLSGEQGGIPLLPALGIFGMLALMAGGAVYAAKRSKA